MPDFELLIEQAYPRILRAALVLTGNPCDADDLAQETFLQALEGWPRYAGRSRPETWLYSILLNVHRQRLRSRARTWRRWLKWFQAAPARGPESPDRRLEQQEWNETLWSTVARLPAPQQHAVVLRYAEELSYEEIAEVMQCPVGTVKSRLHQALNTLERKLGKDNHQALPTEPLR